MKQEVFCHLIARECPLVVDLFASHLSYKTKDDLTEWVATTLRGPDAMSVEWGKLNSIYLFSAPRQTSNVQICCITPNL